MKRMCFYSDIHSSFGGICVHVYFLLWLVPPFGGLTLILLHRGSIEPRLILYLMTGRPEAGSGSSACCLPGNHFELALRRVPIMGTV